MAQIVTQRREIVGGVSFPRLRPNEVQRAAGRVLPPQYEIRVERFPVEIGSSVRRRNEVRRPYQLPKVFVMTLGKKYLCVQLEREISRESECAPKDQVKLSGAAIGEDAGYPT